MAQERWVFPLDCPDCKCASGYPYEATTMRGSASAVLIGLRCRDCHHEWDLELDTEKMPNTDKESEGGT